MIAVVSPELIILGGGVGTRPGLLERAVRALGELLGGYLAAPPVVPPGLGRRSGVLAALALAADDLA